MAAEELEVTIEIMCAQLPATRHRCLHLGIQRDKEITEAASTDAKRMVFKPKLRARGSSDGSVNFLGPFAQGPKSERCIYLNWVMAGEKGLTDMIGRIKLHLNHITRGGDRESGGGE
jgi:hypothetical protein